MHQKVKELNDKRLMLGLTTYRISKDTGISTQTLDNIFNGVHEPKIGFYFRLEEYFKDK